MVRNTTNVATMRALPHQEYIFNTFTSILLPGNWYLQFDNPEHIYPFKPHIPAVAGALFNLRASAHKWLEPQRWNVLF